MKVINTIQYRVLKVPFSVLKLDADDNYVLHSNCLNEYYVSQADSLLFDQIKQITNKGKGNIYINEIVFIQAKKNPKKTAELKKVLMEGFIFNGIRYKRFGKSNSQAKLGITAFVAETIFDELQQRAMLDLTINECVISKFESYKNLIFSNCTVYDGKLPYIVIADEYTKVLENQHIKYAEEGEGELVDKDTNEVKKFKQRVIKDGIRDIQLSPFDGCGVHSKEFGAKVAQTLGIYDYIPVGLQVRMPYMKGLSVEFPFKEWCAEHNVKYIFDVFGKAHKVEDIDCIWNTTMWKAYKLFKNEYGKEGWNVYLDALNKYNFKLGISKYSHHTSHVNVMARLNFQYIQCLDLWNEDYIKAIQNKEKFDILNDNGKVIQMAKYQTDLFEKIIGGDKFYTLKFLGLTDTSSYEPINKYVEAIMINDDMMYDPTIRKHLYRKLSNSIHQMKYGKIYSSGFYHTIMGDLIGYMEYVTGVDVNGCLNAGEFYCNTTIKGEAISFRSPLMCPSEVNKVHIVNNEETNKWLSHFKDQDVCMINMYDLTMPQQGGIKNLYKHLSPLTVM